MGYEYDFERERHYARGYDVIRSSRETQLDRWAWRHSMVKLF